MESFQNWKNSIKYANYIIKGQPVKLKDLINEAEESTFIILRDVDGGKYAIADVAKVHENPTREEVKQILASSMQKEPWFKARLEDGESAEEIVNAIVDYNGYTLVVASSEDEARNKYRSRFRDE